VNEKRRSLRALLLLRRPPCHASHRTRRVNRVRNSFLWKTNFLLGVLTELGTCRAYVCMLTVCPCLLRVAVRSTALLPGYTKRPTRSRACAFHLSLSRSSICCRCSLVFPVPATAFTAVQESKPPKPCPLRSCTGRRTIMFLGSVST
jgi:hypothetical protein